MPIPLAAIAVGASLAGSGLQLGRGVSQIIGGNKRLRELRKKQRPKFLTAQQIAEQADTMVTGGFTPQQQAAFYQSLNRGANAAYRRGVAQSPNLSSAIQAGLNYQQAGALVDFGAQDANIEQQKEREMRGLIQGQSNRQVQDELDYRDRMEMEYGNAVRDGWQNTVGAFDSASNAFATMDAMKTPAPQTGAGTETERTNIALMAPTHLNQLDNPMEQSLARGEGPVIQRPENTPPYAVPATNDEYFSQSYGAPYGGSNSAPWSQAINRRPPSATVPDDQYMQRLYNGPFSPQKDPSWRVVY